MISQRHRDTKKDDGGGNHLAAPCSPVVVAKNKHKQQKNDGGNGDLAAPGSPVVTADSGNGDDGSSNSGGYNNGNIKKFDISKSSFRISGSDGKVVEYGPGFNETFYNSALPYCYAVTSGSCYDSFSGRITP